MKIRITFLVSLALSFVLWISVAAAQDAYFETESLNTGLSDVPPGIDRSTPRATLESLYRAARAEAWDAAAHLLDLSSLPEELQAEEGAQLARKLKSVIDRKIVVDWGEIVDRPDGMDTAETSNSATAGMTRRSLMLWEFDVTDVPSSILLNRIKPDGAEPVWVFSNRTVEDIPPLYNAFGPSRFENLLPDMLRRDSIWGLMLWELMGIPILLVLSSVVGTAVHRVVKAFRKRATQGLARRILRAASTPLIIASVTAVTWWFAANVFVFSGKIDVFVSPLVAIGFVSATLMLVLNVLEQVLDAFAGFVDTDELTTRQAAEKREKATKVAALRRVLALSTFLIGTGIVLASANVFQWLGVSLLASAGALTLVLGFAARKVLGNIMASIQISMNKSAQVGDRVSYKDHLCHVERINFTYVQLRDWTGIRLVVPVEEFASETYENWTLKEPEMLRILEFKLSPTVDVDALRDAFEGVIAEIDPEELDEKEKAKVVVTGQDVFGIDVWFYVPCADPNTSWDVACEARELLLKRLNEMNSDETPIFPEATAAEAA